MLLCYWNRYIGWYLNVENLFRNNFVNIGSWALTSSRYRVLVDMLMEVLKLAVTEDLICGNCSAAISRLLYQKACWYKIKKLKRLCFSCRGLSFLSMCPSSARKDEGCQGKFVQRCSCWATWCAEFSWNHLYSCWCLWSSRPSCTRSLPMPHFWNSYVSFQ